LKAIILKRFSKSSKTYDKWAIPQRYCARRLLEISKPWGRILDVGAGTGTISKILKKDIINLDISKNMLLSFEGKRVVGDAECLPFKDKSFDWALSSFALHWTNIKVSLKEMRRVARNIAVCVPTEGSLKELGFPFPKREDIEDVLCGCEAFFEKVYIPFEGKELLKFFHYTGTSFNPKKRPTVLRKDLINIYEKIKRPYFLVGYFILVS